MKQPNINFYEDNGIRWSAVGVAFCLAFLSYAVLSANQWLEVPLRAALSLFIVMAGAAAYVRPDRCVLMEPWLMKFDGGEHTIPEGYQFDGASVPRLLWTFTGYIPYGLHIAAALEHDRLCEMRGMIMMNDGTWKAYSFLQAHWHFYKRLRLWKVRKAKSWIMGAAVIVFGPKWLTPKIKEKQVD